MTYKMAQDLKVGDRIQAVIGVNRSSEEVEVLAIKESVQVVKRKVVLVTVRNVDGKIAHKTFFNLKPFEVF